MMILRGSKGFTLIELLIVCAIIGILAAIGIPAYVGQQKNAERTEAYTNLQNLRLLEEQFFADRGTYTSGDIGTANKDQPGNIALIQSVLTGFKPGAGSTLSFSYWIEENKDVNGSAKTPCFRASAVGNTGKRVHDEIYRIDCDNNRAGF